MTERKTTEAQMKATQAWRERNRENHKYSSYRSTARTFVRHYADDGDIEDLLKIYKKENKNCKNF